MKNAFLSITLILVLSISGVFSQVPHKISYQGILTDIDGTALNGNYSIQFSLWNEETAGNLLWLEVQQVTVNNGNFDVYLGINNPIVLPFDIQYWLEIIVNNSALPRVMLTSSPYSFISNTVIDNAITNEKIANGTIQAEDLNQMGAEAGNVLSWNGNSWMPVELPEIEETDPVFNASYAATIAGEDITNWNTAYSWGNHADAGYLTSFIEADPLFSSSWANSITGDDISNWNTAFAQGTEAYSWGNHADYGYLTSFIEADPLFASSWANSITGDDISNWNTAYGWGDHAAVGYLTSEVDPNFTASPASGILAGDITNWNAAYGWGDHANVGYLTSYYETDPIFTASPSFNITNTNKSNWNTAYSWGNHAIAGYLTSFTENDPVFTASAAAGITYSSISNWNAAYGWGNHANAGYMTSSAFNATPAGGITATNISNWNTAFGWGDHASAGYLIVSGLNTNGVPVWSGSSLINGSIFNVLGNVGIGVSSPSSKLEVQGGSVLFSGTSGTTPVSGFGTRLMWIPSKQSFRAGGVAAGNWDDANIGIYSNVFGYNSIASGDYTFASGYANTVSGDYASAFGYSNTASGDRSFAFGLSNTASNDEATAFGWGTTASGEDATSMGIGTTAQAYASLAIGRYNVISGTSSSWVATDPLFVIGNGTATASRSNAFTVLKNANTGINTDSPLCGFHVKNASVLYEGTTGATPTSGAGTRFMWIPAKKALRAGSVTANNWDNDSIGDYSVAFGTNSKASSSYSFAVGNNANASGYASVAMNLSTTASGDKSVAFGNCSLASGVESVAMGNGTTASGDYSTAFGRYTISSGSQSLAMGYESTASGNSSVAMGNTATASGTNSTAMGYGTTASGTDAVAMGRYTTAQAYASLVLGRYNLISGTTTTWTATEPVFVIGNGTSSTATSNAFTVNKNGNTGISRLPATNKLEVEGAASKTTAGDWLANSDRRIKTDIFDIDNSIDLLMKLRPVKFRYTPEYIKLHPFIENKYYYNFIAQEYQEVFPESVKGSGELLNGTNQEILQIDTYNSQIITIKAVQELVKENEKLNKKIDELQNELMLIKQLLQNNDSKK